jgi:hypothetical protein
MIAAVFARTEDEIKTHSSLKTLGELKQDWFKKRFLNPAIWIESAVFLEADPRPYS